jgi:hypothetical protein
VAATDTVEDEPCTGGAADGFAADAPLRTGVEADDVEAAEDFEPKVGG